MSQAVDADGVVDARELRVRVLLRQLREVVGENEAHAHHEVHAFRGKQPETGLAIGAVTGLDEPDLRPEIALRPLAA